MQLVMDVKRGRDYISCVGLITQFQTSLKTHSRLFSFLPLHFPHLRLRHHFHVLHIKKPGQHMLLCVGRGWPALKSRSPGRAESWHRHFWAEIFTWNNWRRRWLKPMLLRHRMGGIILLPKLNFCPLFFCSRFNRQNLYPYETCIFSPLFWLYTFPFQWHEHSIKISPARVLILIGFQPVWGWYFYFKKKQFIFPSTAGRKKGGPLVTAKTRLVVSGCWPNFKTFQNYE